jgi:threonine dehydratase
MMIQKIFKNILTARVYDVAIRSPLEKAERISKQLRNDIYLKREDLQPVFSFKLRGAYNKIAHLTAEERSQGIICASAGNHAQGVALSAQKLGISATIVMPQTTPAIKVLAVKSYGVEVILKGDNYSESAEHCSYLQAQSGAIFIHPFDDELVIAGQGTIGYEILQQYDAPDYIFVPVGGGGLLAGIATYVKELYPDVKIIGVEPSDSNAMQKSVRAGERIELEKVGIFADGVAVKQVGDLTYQLCEKYVDDWVEVETDEICSAIKSIYEDTRSIVEPAGALSVAGIRKYLQQNRVESKSFIAINSGANMNFDRLRFVAERTLTGEQKEAILAISIPEKVGALKILCEKVLGKRAITEFNYRLASRDQAHIFISVSIKDWPEKKTLENTLNQNGFEYTDLTANELAKVHVRYMIGGKAQEAKNEIICRFTFPERPGALINFLAAVSEKWNISLFHYRAQGGNFGRVLMGFEIPPEDQRQFFNTLDSLKYPYLEETTNKAYKLFL